MQSHSRRDQPACDTRAYPVGDTADFKADDEGTSKRFQLFAVHGQPVLLGGRGGSSVKDRIARNKISSVSLVIT